MFPRIENTRTPAVKQVQVLTMQVIKASLKCICFVLKVRFCCVMAFLCLCSVVVVRENKKTIS